MGPVSAERELGQTVREMNDRAKVGSEEPMPGLDSPPDTSNGDRHV